MAKHNPTHITAKVKLCMHTKFMSVVPRVCLVKVPFLTFFVWSDTNAGRGVALLTFLKDSPGDSDSKYIYGFMGTYTLVKVLLSKDHFWYLHIKMKRSGQVGTTPCYSQCQVVYSYKKNFFLACNFMHFSGKV